LRFSSGYHGHSKSPVEVARQSRVTLNDLPVPSGSWQEHHNKRNAKWNLQLAGSALFFVATAFSVCCSGMLQLTKQNLKGL